MPLNSEKPKLTSKQRRNAIIIGVSILAFIAFLIQGLPRIIEPPLMAHGSTVAYHWHVRLTVIDSEGNTIRLPDTIGHRNLNYEYRDLDEYGTSQFAPAHTHSSDGIVHIESRTERVYTLGEFIHIWGNTNFIDKEPELVANGHLVEGNYMNYEMHDGDQLRLDFS